MPGTLTEYHEKIERLREILPWATDELLGLILSRAESA
jgi:hypothetical protein